MHPIDKVCSVTGAHHTPITSANRLETTHQNTTQISGAHGVPSGINNEHGTASSSTISNSTIHRRDLETSPFIINRVSTYDDIGDRSESVQPNYISSVNNTHSNHELQKSSQPEAETDTPAIREEEDNFVPVLSKPRVSFEEVPDTAEFTPDTTQIYKDVVTLQVPSNENLWLSCRESKKKLKRLRWFRKSHQVATSPAPSSWSWLFGRRNKMKASSDEMEVKPNGNHINSVYENEADQKLVSDNWPDDSSAETAIDRNGLMPENKRPREQTGHDWEADSSRGEDESSDHNSMVWTTNFLAALSILLIIVTFPFSLIYCIRIVAEYERAVVLRMGNLIPKGKGTKGPGLFFILPCIDSVRKVDLRTVTFAIPPQELLTRDSVTVSVDAVVYYRVLNPVASVLNIEDAARSTRLLAQTTIRNVLGTKDLAQILMDRDEISTSMQSSLDATTDAWGVKVERVEIKDVRLPIQLQRAMAAEAEAAREARAKVIAATGEQEAARSLKKAARVIATSPMAFQLRYLQTLCAISAEKNSTIFFPVPIDIMQNLGDFGSLGAYAKTSSKSLGSVNGWMRPQVQSLLKPEINQSVVFAEAKAKSGGMSIDMVKPMDDTAETIKDDAYWLQMETDEHSDTV